MLLLNKLMHYLTCIAIKIRRKNVLAQCGHLTKREDRLTAFGDTIFCKIPIDKNGRTPYCHCCLEVMTIRCAWCGSTIFIGDPVTLYSPADDSQEMPDYAVKYGNDAYVGCLRWNCAESGADRSGFWYPPGKVHRTLSPLEQCLQSGEMVIVSDLGDMRQAIPLETGSEE